MAASCTPSDPETAEKVSLDLGDAARDRLALASSVELFDE
jgi:hypothetical protein